MNENFDSICRTCVTKQEKMHSLFPESNQHHANFAEMLTSISIQVTPDDDLPKYICEKCSKMLSAAYNFKEQCKQAHTQLHKYLEQKFSVEELIDSNLQDDLLFSLILIKAKTIGNSDFEEEEEQQTLLTEEQEVAENPPQHSRVLEKQIEEEEEEEEEELSKIEPCFLVQPSKVFTCKLCNKNFNSSYGLYYHKKCHQGIRNHICPYENCKKRFIDSQSLKKHKSIHTNERKHLCSICGKRFNLKDSLNYHLKTHGQGRLHLCSYCGRCFKQSCHLKIHTWKHTGIKPYVCSTCGREYTTGGQLKKHLRKYCGIGNVLPKRNEVKNAPCNYADIT